MNKKIGNIFKGDKVIWMVFFFLCLISVVEVFSASSSLTYKNESYWGPAIYHGRIDNYERPLLLYDNFRHTIFRGLW